MTVYILLGEGFEEAEALVPADILRRGGVDVKLTGVGGMRIRGGHGITVEADTAAEGVTLAPGDMLVLPGGLGGVASMEASGAAMALARTAAADSAIYLAAICAAPDLLARKGLIPAGTHAVCYPGMEGAMVRSGALPQLDKSAVTDGMLITGRGPGAAFDFGLALLTALKGEDAAEQVRREMYYCR